MAAPYEEIPRLDLAAVAAAVNAQACGDGIALSATGALRLVVDARPLPVRKPGRLSALLAFS